MSRNTPRRITPDGTSVVKNSAGSTSSAAARRSMTGKRAPRYAGLDLGNHIGAEVGGLGKLFLGKAPSPSVRGDRRPNRLRKSAMPTSRHDCTDAPGRAAWKTKALVA